MSFSELVCFVRARRNMKPSIISVSVKTKAMLFMISPMYRWKGNGPSTEPCGSPYLTCDQNDTSFLTAKANCWVKCHPA